jgi:hypothetical protein
MMQTRKIGPKEWNIICSNSALGALIAANPQRMTRTAYWKSTCSNRSPMVMRMLLKKMQQSSSAFLCKMNWHALSMNPSAMPILEVFSSDIWWNI